MAKILIVEDSATMRNNVARLLRATKKGYEIELRFNKNINDWHIWANASMTHAVDKILSKEEPQLKDPHLLAAGFQIDQTDHLCLTNH